MWNRCGEATTTALKPVEGRPVSVYCKERYEAQRGRFLPVLNELIEAGRQLLRSHPMSKDDCVQWSDTARAAVVGRYGSSSPKTLEFLKARWEISTSELADPSMYLTQVGANLRREMRLLDKLLMQEEETTGTPTPKTAPPPPAVTTAPPARKKVLIFGGKNWEHLERVIAVVGELGLSAVEVADGDRQSVGSIRSMLEADDLTAALLVVERDPASRGAKIRPKIDSILEFGVLIGVLGAARIFVLVDPRVSMPARAEGVSVTSLEDLDSVESGLRDFLKRS